jgi:hypothetical protein
MTSSPRSPTGGNGQWVAWCLPGLQRTHARYGPRAERKPVPSRPVYPDPPKPSIRPGSLLKRQTSSDPKRTAPTVVREVEAKVTITREADAHRSPITTQIDARLSRTWPSHKKEPRHERPWAGQRSGFVTGGGNQKGSAGVVSVRSCAFFISSSCGAPRTIREDIPGSRGFWHDVPSRSSLLHWPTR